MHNIREHRLTPEAPNSILIAVRPLTPDLQPSGSLKVGHCITVSSDGLTFFLAEDLDATFFHVEVLDKSDDSGFEEAVVETTERTRESMGCTYSGRFIPSAQV